MKVPIKNPGNSPMYVGSKMIHPGETGHFELDELPAHLRPQPVVEVQEEIEQTDPLAELLAHRVKDIIAALPTLSDDELEELGRREQLAEKPRKNLLSAIGEVVLDRATTPDDAAGKGKGDGDGDGDGDGKNPEGGGKDGQTVDPVAGAARQGG